MKYTSGNTLIYFSFFSFFTDNIILQDELDQFDTGLHKVLLHDMHIA